MDKISAKPQKFLQGSWRYVTTKIEGPGTLNFFLSISQDFGELVCVIIEWAYDM